MVMAVRVTENRAWDVTLRSSERVDPLEGPEACHL